MREGRQNEGDDTGQPAGKVVRLPRDWLGPREELVPFGGRPTAPRAPAYLASPTDTPDYPASAADFWGEDSAAIHDALQAPAEDRIETPPSPTAGVSVPARRRVLVAAGLAVAAAVIAALASVGFGVDGSPSHASPTGRMDVAAVISGGISRMLQQGVGIIGASARASAGRGHGAPAPRPRARPKRRTAHPHAVFKPVHESARPEPSTPVHYSTPTSADVVHAAPPSAAARSTTTPAGGGTSQASITPTHHVSSSPTTRSSHPSSAAVSPTGASGALGPVNSPNG